MEPSPIDHDLEPSAEARPRYRRNLRSRYEATTLAPRANQAPRRTPVRWYPTHGYQHDRPSLLQAPSLSMARVLTMKRAPSEADGVRAFRRRPPKPRAVEGSESTIAKGGAISVSPHRALSRSLRSPRRPRNRGRDPTTQRHARSWRHRGA